MIAFAISVTIRGLLVFGCLVDTEELPGHRGRHCRLWRQWWPPWSGSQEMINPAKSGA